MLLGHEGEPVFPVKKLTDLGFLRNFAAENKVEITYVEGKECSPSSDPPYVLGVLGETDEEAALYAHLTNRGLKLVAPNTLPSTTLTDVEVIVCLLTRITVELIRYVTSRKDPSSIGFITGDTSGEIMTRVLLTSADLGNRKILPNKIGALYTGHNLKPTVDGDSVQILDKNSSNSKIRELLGNNHNVLSVLTHSDGVDAKLSKSLSLCRMPLPANDKAMPLCLVTGICFRHNQRISTAKQAGKLFHPSEIRTRILVLAACNSFLDSHTSVAQEYGYLSGVLKAQHVKAIAFTPSIIIPPKNIFESILTSLCHGETLGISIAKSNSSELGDKANSHFVLFGDPRIQSELELTSQDLRHVYESTSDDKFIRSDPKSNSELNEGLGFLREYLMNILVDSSDEITEIVSKALLSLRNYEYFYWNGFNCDDEYLPTSVEFRENILNVLKHRGAAVIAHDWINLCHDKTRMGNLSCPHCDSELDGFLYHFRDVSITDRQFLICGRCHVVQDAPSKTQIFLRLLKNDKFVLIGQLPRRNWSAFLRLSCADDNLSISFDWPSDATGMPLRELTVEKSLWPIGPLKASYAMVHDSSLVVANCPIIGGFREEKVS